MYALEEGQVEIVKILIEAGTDVGVKCGLGQTALMKATERGHAEI